MKIKSLTAFSIELKLRKLIYFSPLPIKIQLQVLSQDRIKLIWQIVTSQSMQQICRELGEHQKATNNRQLTLVYLPNSTQNSPHHSPTRPSVSQAKKALGRQWNFHFRIFVCEKSKRNVGKKKVYLCRNKIKRKDEASRARRE